MCPHTLGTNNGREHALFYQFGGGSSSGLSTDPRQNWRCMFLDELSNVSACNGPWHSGPNHSRPQRCVAVIDVEVSY